MNKKKILKNGMNYFKRSKIYHKKRKHKILKKIN